MDTVVKLRSKYVHVSHIKEAGGSVDRVDQLKGALGDDIIVLSGDDSLTVPFMSVGRGGCHQCRFKSLTSRSLSRLVKAAAANDFAKAAKMHRKLYPLFKALFLEPNPVPVKFAMHQAGLIGSTEVRAPLCKLSAAGRKTLNTVLKTL